MTVSSGKNGKIGRRKVENAGVWAGCMNMNHQQNLRVDPSAIVEKPRENSAVDGGTLSGEKGEKK